VLPLHAGSSGLRRCGRAQTPKGDGSWRQHVIREELVSDGPGSHHEGRSPCGQRLPEGQARRSEVIPRAPGGPAGRQVPGGDRTGCARPPPQRHRARRSQGGRRHRRPCASARLTPLCRGSARLGPVHSRDSRNLFSRGRFFAKIA